MTESYPGLAKVDLMIRQSRDYFGDGEVKILLCMVNPDTPENMRYHDAFVSVYEIPEILRSSFTMTSF